MIETDKILSNFITAEEGRISCTAEYCLAACGDREGVRYGTLARPRRQYHARGKRVTLIPKCFYMRDHFQITRNDIRCQDCRVMRIAKSSCARVHEWRLVALHSFLAINGGGPINSFGAAARGPERVWTMTIYQ